MRIVIITQMYPQPDDLGGNKVTKTIEYFAKEWVAEGNKVIVIHCSSKFPIFLYMIPHRIKDIFAYKTSTIIPSFSSRKKLIRENLGIKIYRIPMRKFFPGRSYSKHAIDFVAKEIENLLADECFCPDLVMGHFANPSLEIVADLADYYKCKSSIVFHNECNPKSVVKYRVYENIGRVGAVGARSILESKHIKLLLNLKELPFVCYSGVPNDAIENASKTCLKHDYSNGIKYLYVGSLITRKHVDKVIKAFDTISSSNDSLNIVGGGPEEQKLKKIVQGIKSKKIKFVGRLSRHDVLDIMKSSHVFALISENETFGMVYIEAMLQGCLVIASKNGGFDGIIKDGVNGFLCNSGDSNMLIEIFEKISKMSFDERNKIAQNAINTALKFSEKAVADMYLNDVLKRNGDNL